MSSEALAFVSAAGTAAMAAVMAEPSPGSTRRRRTIGVRAALVWEVVTGGLRELWAHKLRSALTLTLLMLGVFALVVMVSVLPKTRSGKLLRRAMQAVAEGRDVQVPVEDVQFGGVGVTVVGVGQPDVRGQVRVGHGRAQESPLGQAGVGARVEEALRLRGVTLERGLEISPIDGDDAHGTLSDLTRRS